jgi:acetylornithine/succinyldiaminopimelate/putrescine aminotransferase
MLNLTELIRANVGRNLALHERINPQFAKVLTTIGFDKTYVRAEGASLFDKDGREYLDFLSGYGVYAFGRNHPKLKSAIKDVLDLDLSNLVQMDAPLLAGLFAEKLIEVFGHGVRDTVFFVNSGTEANEGAIKFARCATGRDKILHLDHAFHGLSNGSLSANGNAEFRDGFGTLLPSESVPINDLATLEDKLKTESYAAFLFEPIQGKGVYVPQDGYLQTAADLCRKYGTLTIADEVQTGVGRTGKWLASEHFGVEADIITLSKALSGGMVQTGAIVYKRAIYDKVFSRMDRCVVHSNTFGKNNLSMACGLTSLAIVEEEGLLQNAEKIGGLLVEKLNALKSKHDWILEVRGKGLMIGIEFGKPAGFKKKLVWDAVHKMDKGLFGELVVMPLLSKHGILTQVSGHHQDIVKLIPPLTITESHVEKFVAALDDVLSDCDKVTGPILSMGKNLAKHVVKSRAS